MVLSIKGNGYFVAFILLYCSNTLALRIDRDDMIKYNTVFYNPLCKSIKIELIAVKDIK